jgi:hypothetical protein
MNTSVDDDLNGKNVVINKEPFPFAVNDNQPPEKSENAPKKFVKNAYSKLVFNIKNIVSKKQEPSQEIPKAEEVSISSSQEEQADTEPKTCKDKVANTIISKVEVEKNKTVFFSLLAIGSFLLCINLLMIPLIITSPSKFSMTLAFGSSFVLISFLFYYGTKNYVMKLFDKKRFLLSLLFISSIILAIVFWFLDNYFLSLLSCLFQSLCFILFGLSFIPGGQSGISYIKKKISSPFVKIFMNVAKKEITNS